MELVSVIERLLMLRLESEGKLYLFTDERDYPLLEKRAGELVAKGELRKLELEPAVDGKYTVKAGYRGFLLVFLRPSDDVAPRLARLDDMATYGLPSDGTGKELFHRHLEALRFLGGEDGMYGVPDYNGAVSLAYRH